MSLNDNKIILIIIKNTNYYLIIIKNTNFLDWNWFMKLISSTNSLATLLSDSLLSGSLINQS